MGTANWWNKVEANLDDAQTEQMDAGLGEFLLHHDVDEDAWNAATQHDGALDHQTWLREALRDMDHAHCDVDGPEHKLWLTAFQRHEARDDGDGDVEIQSEQPAADQEDVGA